MNMQNIVRRIVGAGVPEADRDLHTEISEKQTTKLGYVLIIFMVLFGVWYGQTVLDDLQSNISSPVPLPSCITSLNNSDTYGYYYGGNESSCTPTTKQVAAGYTPLFTEAKRLAEAVNAARRAVDNAQSNLSQATYQQNKYRNDYDISLQESQAGVAQQTVDGTQQSYATGYTQVEIAQAKLNAAQQELANTQDAQRRYGGAHAAEITAMQNAYERSVVVADLLRFLLTIILIAPLFWVTLRRWVIAKDKGAYTTIIWAGAATIFGLLFAQIVSVFIYRILPHRFLTKLFEFLAQMDWMLSLLRYAALILIPALFGYIVYQIQKRIYSPRAVFLRALKSQKCPKCSLHLTPDMRHCPVCGTAIKETCENTNVGTHDRYVGSDYCATCGTIHTS